MHVPMNLLPEHLMMDVAHIACTAMSSFCERMSTAAVAGLTIVASATVASSAIAQTFDGYVGVIIVAAPDHPASKNYGVSLIPYFHTNTLNFGPARLRSPDEGGLSISPAVNFVSEHRGVGDIYEAGLRIGYRVGNVRPWIEARQQFGGSHGVPGRTGVDFIAPFFGGSIEAGPRLWFADRGANRVEFNESSAGTHALGTGLLARLPLTNKISLLGTAEWKYYTGGIARAIDARDDARDEFTVGFGLAYRLRID